MYVLSRVHNNIVNTFWYYRLVLHRYCISYWYIGYIHGKIDHKIVNLCTKR